MTQPDGRPEDWEFVPADRGSGAFRIDVEGQWYHDGVRIVVPSIVRLLADHVIQGEDGTFILRWGPHEHPLAVADTPAVLRGVDRPDPITGQFCGRLVDGRTLSFEAARVWIGEQHVLYTALPNGEPVRFSRPAYYQLAAWIVEQDGGFAIAVGKRVWPIAERKYP